MRIWDLLDHENVAVFHGVVYNSNGAPAIVSPWYANGSADVYLRQHPDTNPMTIVRGNTIRLPDLLSLRI